VKLSLHYISPHYSHLLDYDDDDHAVDEYDDDDDDDDVYRHRSEVDEFPSYSI
jgi:hypothetical protein